MNDILEKTLKQMYDEFLRTGGADWMSIDTVVGKQLESLGYVHQNTLGEFELTKAGIAYMSK